MVCEALRIGVPVLASRISGNVGLLGRDYAAYFRPQDEVALARLITRSATEPAFYSNLVKQIRVLRAVVAPRKEARSLIAAVTKP